MTTRKYTFCAVGLLAAVLAISLLPQMPVANGLVKSLPFKSTAVLWCAVILIQAFLLPRTHVPGRLRLRGHMLGIALTTAAALLALRFTIGFLLKSVAKSPYNLTPYGIFLNMLDIIPALAVRETVRAFNVGAACRGRKRSVTIIWIIALTFALALADANFTKIVYLKNVEDWFIYIAKDIMPLLMQSAFVTVLATYGGAAASFVYCGAVAVFLHVFPFLPSLPWVAESAFGIAFPPLAALFVLDRYRIMGARQRTGRHGNIAPFSVALVLSVAFAWFMVGVFPVYPSVILTGSMEPGIYPGDVVLIRKFSSEVEIYALKEGDVVNFKREDITVTHRITAVFYDDAGNISFETKGDNNKSPDKEPLLPNDLNGTVISVVPKVGMPILLMNSRSTVPEGVQDN